MKFFSLHLDTPCPEDISNIKRNASGFFCDLCTKQVLDLTKMTPEEILNLLNKSNGNICASVTKEQLQTPIIHFDKPEPVSKLPYSKLAAGIMLATSLTNPPNLEAQNYSPYIQTEVIVPAFNKGHLYSIQSLNKKTKTSTINGVILKKGTNESIEHAKIECITPTKIYTTYTDKNGKFTLTLPAEYVKEENIFRCSFNTIVHPSSQKNPFYRTYYSNATHIFSKTSLSNNLKIYAEVEHLVDGGIGIRINHSEIKSLPIVVYNGVKITYKDLRQNRYNLRDKTPYIFGSKIGQILFGKSGKFGVRLYFDEIID